MPRPRWAIRTSHDDLPGNVRKEATRTLLNYVGVAVGGSHHETVDIAVVEAIWYGPFANTRGHLVLLREIGMAEGRIFDKAMLDTLPELLLRLSIRKPILIGHSDGASIALIHAGARVGRYRGRRGDRL